MPDTEKEDTLERRRLQNRMAQRRFRERHSKKKTSNGNIHQLNDAVSQTLQVLETATTPQPSLDEGHLLWAPFEALPYASAEASSNQIDGDLDCDLFGDEHLLHDLNFSSFEFPTAVGTDETDQLSNMAVKGHDIAMASSCAVLGHRHIPLPSTPRTNPSTRSRSSASNSMVGLWPRSPSSSVSLPLVVNNTDINANDSTSESWHGPLHIAARNGNNRITQLLVQHATDCNEKDSDGRTPLMLAVIGGHDDVVTTLLSHGASVTEADNELRTVLHLAILHRRADLLQAILAECPRDSETINAYDASGMTPLHMAIDLGFAPGVQSLLKVGADVGSKARRK
ncbi:hypothetical protein NX059_011065 [Plenodomus lindquistii]|nr:hypothetical protein NX059_011065 [Plenodomus lindquistii]